MKDIKITCGEKLESLVKNITVTDRTDAVTEIPISRPTLDRYLNGEIIKAETAIKLIRFFSNRITARMKELDAIRI